MHEQQRIQELADKWVKGTLNTAERKELEDWYATGQDLPVTLPQHFASSEEEHGNLMLQTIRAKAGLTVLHKNNKRRIIGWAAAAVVLLLAGTIYLLRPPSSSNIPVQTASDAAPGRNGATLQLADGRTIQLDSLANGIVAEQGNIKAIKENGALKYAGASDQVAFNTISTSHGRQWQLTLPDGTKVWLNAAASLRYPTAFKGNTREVALTGEAYFEVAHNAAQPFVVKVGAMDVKVLGTHFNINAYSNEAAVRTTLLEGSVEVRKNDQHKLIVPGKQAVVAGNSIEVITANTAQVTAWKDGIFNFDKLSLEDVMRQLERWYDIKVVYEGKVRPMRFRGEMGRDLNLSQVIKVLEQTHVHFVIEGQTLKVLSN